jgi:hypothetical protein
MPSPCLSSKSRSFLDVNCAHLTPRLSCISRSQQNQFLVFLHRTRSHRSVQVKTPKMSESSRSPVIPEPCQIELTKAERPRVYFDIEIGGVKQGRVVFELVSLLTVPAPLALLTSWRSTVMVRSPTCFKVSLSSDTRDSCPQNSRELSRAQYWREGYRKDGQAVKLQRLHIAFRESVCQVLRQVGRVNISSGHQRFHDSGRRLHRIQWHWWRVDIWREV